MQVVRLSIPGNECVHCGTIITEKLKCSGCGWIDPMTKSPERPGFEQELRESQVEMPSEFKSAAFKDFRGLLRAETTEQIVK